MPIIRLDAADIADLATPIGMQAAGGDALSDPVFDYLIGVAVVVYEMGGGIALG